MIDEVALALVLAPGVVLPELRVRQPIPPLPRSAAEAKRLARILNGNAAAQRARVDQSLAEFDDALAASSKKIREGARPSPAAKKQARASLDPAAIYAERARVRSAS